LTGLGKENSCFMVMKTSINTPEFMVICPVSSESTPAGSQSARAGCPSSAALVSGTASTRPHHRRARGPATAGDEGPPPPARGPRSATRDPRMRIAD